MLYSKWAYLSITRLVAADRNWELLNLEDGDKGDGGRFGGGARETAGGVGKRLRWAQSGPERGVGSPEARNTHIHTDTFHHVS